MSKKQYKTNTARTSTALALQETGAPATAKANSPGSDLIPTLATETGELSNLLMLQAMTTDLPFGESNEALNARFVEAAVRSICPRDGLEALLAAQMVHTHNLAMSYLRRAAVKDQTSTGTELLTDFANRLLRTYVAQVEALKTYRSKGEQKVEVRHVDVHRGGQAIVGAVSHSAGGGDEK